MKLLVIWTLLMAFRVGQVFTIPVLDAPDEAGHMILITAMAQGRLMTLEEEHLYRPRYSYALFHPAAYVPYALGLRLAAIQNPALLDLQKPHPAWKDSGILAARLGGLVWAALFCFFLVLLTQHLAAIPRALILVLVGLLPQLVFTQSYANLDAMGTASMLFLVWALDRRSIGWTTAAVTMVLASKLNYYCVLVLPVWIYWQYRKSVADFFGRNLVVFGAAFALNLPWFIYSYRVNTAKYGSLLGFSALQKIYSDPPGGWNVAHRSFLGLTLNSGFGIFGYFSRPMPTAFLWVWKGIFFPLGCFFLAKALSENGRDKTWNIGLAAVVALNFFLHFWASFTGALSPQGRYLFPAFCILLVYWVRGFESWRQGPHKFKARLAGATEATAALFMLASSCIAFSYL